MSESGGPSQNQTLPPGGIDELDLTNENEIEDNREQPLPPGGKDALDLSNDDEAQDTKNQPKLPPDPEHYDVIEQNAMDVNVDVHPAITKDDMEIRKRYHENNGNLQLLIAFSIVIMADANEQEGSDGDIERQAGPALGFACASFIVCFLKYVASCVQSDVNPAVEIFVAFLLIIVWTVGVILLTFQEDGVFFEVSSGFFATWASLLVSANYFFSTAGKLGGDEETKDETLIGKKKTKVTDGLNGYFGVGLILSISTIAAGALIIEDTPKRARAVSLIVFAAPLAGGLLIMNFVPFKTYNDPFYFMLLVGSLLLISFLNVLTTLLDEPFAQRRLDIVGQPPVIIANGFFSTLGTFILLSLVLWKAHTLILLFNADNDDSGNYSRNIQGRYIWIFLLFLSTIAVLSAAATECSNFESCDDNGFIGPLIAISFLQAFAIPLVFCVTHGNIDFGDAKIRDPKGYDSNDMDMTTEYRIELVSSLLFFATWIGAASTFTFGVTSPFNTASAGYFFIWLSAFFSAMYFSSVFPKFGLFNMTFFKWHPPNGMKPENNFGFGLVLCGSIVQIAAVIIALNQDIDGQGLQGEDVLTLVLQGIVLFILVLFVFLSPRTLGVCALINSYLLISFTFVILLVTTVFANPFDTAQLGNGFFGAWVSLYGSFFAYNNYEWDLPPLEV